MGWFGGWFGRSGGSSGSEPEPEPTPIPVPVVFGDEAYYDHTLRALDRLAQQFRSDPE